jgi:hypothetical protein
MKKKILKGAVEEQFFSESQAEQIENKPGVKNPQSFDIQSKEEIVNEKGYRTKVVLQEIKSKKFNMLMRPSLYDDLKKVATENKTSISSLIDQVLANFVSKSNNKKIRLKAFKA